MRGKPWKKEEVALLRQHYADRPTSEVAEMLGVSVYRVYHKANSLGLRKSEAYMAGELQRQAERLRKVGAPSRYLKGIVPHNKGKKMSPQVYEKVRRTMFRKGNEPHNTNYDGHERISKDGYVEVRVRKGKYRLKHLHLWEQKNGKLPKGHCLRCIDGNKHNTNPDNWELVTRADNMRMNTIHRYPPEVRELIRLQGKLKRTITKQTQYEKQN